MSIDLSSLTSTLGAVINNNDATLQQALKNVSAKDNPSATDLLDLQQQSQNYTLSVETTSTMVKMLGDLLKSIVQKSG